MAYIVEASKKETAAATALTFTVQLAAGTYAVDDLLVVVMKNNGGSATISQSGGSDWTIEADQANSTNIRQVIAWKIATSTSEADPTFTGLNASWSGYSFVVKDAPASSPIDGSKRANFTGATSGSSGALSAGTDNCLLIYIMCSNGGGQLRFKSDDVTCINTSITANNDSGQLIGYRQFGAAAATPTVTGYASASANGQVWVLAIKNKTSGNLQPFARSGLNEMAWYGAHGSTLGTITNQSPDNFAATVNSITVSTAGATNSTTSDSLNWGTYSTTLSVENFASPPTTKFVGTYQALTFPSMTGKLFSIEWQCPIASTSTQFGSDGILIGFRDAAGNYVTYQLAAEGGWVPAVSQRTTIEIGVTTPYASSGSIDWDNVTGIAFLMHRTAATAAQTAVYYKNAFLFDKATIIGGGASLPASYTDAYKALTSCGISKISTLQGSAQVFASCSVQIGDGTIPTYFDASAQAFEFPLPYNSVTQKDWRVSANIIELSIYGSASDTINLKTGADVTTQSALLTVNASSSNSGTYAFSGRAFVGWAPTFKTGISVSSATFTECGEINAKGTTLTNCTISATASTDAAIAFDTSAGELDSCTIDVTGTSAAYHLELGASVTSVTLTDVTFTGTPGTDKVHVLATTGTVTINISGTTTLAAGDVTSAGATVSIVSDPVYQTVTISGATAGTRIQLYDTTSSTELYNGTPAFPYTWTDGSAAVASRAIRFRATYQSGTSAKEIISVANIGTCGTTAGTEDVSYIVAQSDDSTYNTNAQDGSAVTGMTVNDTNNRIEINRASGAATWAEIYAYYMYDANTSAGIAKDPFDFMSSPDTANFLVTTWEVKNTHATVALEITGGWGRSASTGLTKDIADTTGTSLFIFGDHAIPYSSGSGLTAGQAAQLTTIESATGVSGMVNANVTYVNGVEVDGTGTDADPWGPV